MPYYPLDPPRVAVFPHPRDGVRTGVFVPAHGPAHAANIVATSNYFKPVEKEPWKE